MPPRKKIVADWLDENFDQMLYDCEGGFFRKLLKTVEVVQGRKDSTIGPALQKEGKEFVSYLITRFFKLFRKKLSSKNCHNRSFRKSFKHSKDIKYKVKTFLTIIFFFYCYSFKK